MHKDFFSKNYRLCAAFLIIQIFHMLSRDIVTLQHDIVLLSLLIRYGKMHKRAFRSATCGNSAFYGVRVLPTAEQLVTQKRALCLHHAAFCFVTLISSAGKIGIV